MITSMVRFSNCFVKANLYPALARTMDMKKTTRCFYAPAFVVRDRLDIMGLTVKRAREEFEDAVVDIASEFEDEPLGPDPALG
jgi:hypothetical protein